MDRSRARTAKLPAQSRVTRRLLLGGLGATTAARSLCKSIAAQEAPAASGILVRESGPGGGLALHDPDSGTRLFTFATDGRPEAVWASAMPGIAFVQTDRALSLVDCTTGETRPIALPEAVATQILPQTIQFRGSRGTAKQLIGTPASAGDTYVVDLQSGERVKVMGLISANPPPVTLQNVALAPDDRHLIVWDGRRTWIVDLDTGESHLLGTGQFTFSAGFVSDGTAIAYSQQLASGTTELRIQNLDGSGDRLLYSSTEILVSLPVPKRNALLLDERSDSGGTLSIATLGASSTRHDLLDYTGATNIVQFAEYGTFALVGIEGESGRDWYRLGLNATTGGALLLSDLADAEVQPGFTFNSDWAVAALGADDLNPGALVAVDLVGGSTTSLIEGITTDAALSPVTVAEHGPGAIVTIDSFTELAVHLLDLEFGGDTSFDLMKGGSGVISPSGDRCAIAYDLNTGGTTTIVHDQSGVEGASIPGTALAWVLI